MFVLWIVRCGKRELGKKKKDHEEKRQNKNDSKNTADKTFNY